MYGVLISSFWLCVIHSFEWIAKAKMTTVDFTPNRPEGMNDACIRRAQNCTELEIVELSLQPPRGACPSEIGHVKDTMSFNTDA